MNLFEHSGIDKNKIFKTIGTLLVAAIVFFTMTAKGADIDITIDSDAEIQVGDIFDVTISINGDEQISTYYVELVYDSSRMIYLQGADEENEGSLILTGTGFEDMVIYNLQFEALSGGTGGLFVSSADIYGQNEDANEQFDISLGDSLEITIDGEDLGDNLYQIKLQDLLKTQTAADIGEEANITVVATVNDSNGNLYYVADMSKSVPDISVNLNKTIEGTFAENQVTYLTDNSENVKLLYLADEEGTLNLYAVSNEENLYPVIKSQGQDGNKSLYVPIDACVIIPEEITEIEEAKDYAIYAINEEGEGNFSYLDSEGNIQAWDNSLFEEPEDVTETTVEITSNSNLTTEQIKDTVDSAAENVTNADEKETEIIKNKANPILLILIVLVLLIIAVSIIILLLNKKRNNRRKYLAEKKRYRAAKANIESGDINNKQEDQDIDVNQDIDIKKVLKTIDGEQVISDEKEIVPEDNATTKTINKQLEPEKSKDDELIDEKKKVVSIDQKVVIDNQETSNKETIESLNSADDQKEPIISIQHVTMKYNVATSNVSGLKDYVVQKVKKQLSHREFLALDDVSFDVFKGEVVGIIGTNGSGKSTLLKIVSGALNPTSGKVVVDKSKIQLLTLGTGFDMELTAHENVYLNGSIIGYTREFIDEHYNEIVEFAELQDFMEEKVKNFSSGMVSRLGFAIATVANAAEILILDEVLSVGDEFFRKKSLARIKQMIHGGSTVLMVSHGMGTIRENCSKVVWIEKSKLRMIGDAKTVCKAYQEMEGTQAQK